MIRLFLVFYLLASSLAHGQERLLVFAAASQRDVMLEIADLFEKQCSCSVVYSFAATSTLARQIDAGAGAQVFISANEDWMGWLRDRGNVAFTAPRTVASNRMVVAVLRGIDKGVEDVLGDRFAMADPTNVPAGIYARQSLEGMGLWAAFEDKAVFTENVRVALALVERGDIVSAIVYQSDLKVAPRLHALYEIPPKHHSPIRYLAIAEAGNDLAAQFVAFLGSKPAQSLLKRYDFVPVSEIE